MPAAGKIPCPTCQSPLEPGIPRCPRCGADLGAQGSGKGDGPPDTSLDDILAGIIEDRTKAGLGEATQLDLDLDAQQEEAEAPGAPALPAVDLAPGSVAPAPPAARPDVLSFECPGCGAEVAESATRCPHCGATFSESDQFDCPVCGSAVPFEAVECPKCGVRFVEEASLASSLSLDLTSEPTPAPLPASAEVPAAPPALATPPPSSPAEARPEAVLAPRPSPPASPASAAPAAFGGTAAPAQRQPQAPSPAAADPTVLQRRMSELVTEVKGLIVLGKRSNLGLANVSETITQAVNQAKRRELAEAVTLMTGAKETLERSFVEQIGGRLATLGASVERAGEREGPGAAAVREGQARLQSRDLPGALAALGRAQGWSASGDPRTNRVRAALEAAKGALQQAAAMGVPIAGGDDLMEQASRALARGEFDTAAALANQTQDLATATAKNLLGEEMKRSRNMVFELKMKGESVDRAIDLLKQASARLKDGDSRGAYQLLQALRDALPQSR